MKKLYANNCGIIHDKFGNTIAEVRNIKDAEFIIRIVNLHGLLLEASKAAFHYADFSHNDRANSAKLMLRDAIALAETWL